MNTSARGAARILVFTVAVAALAAACSSSSTPAPPAATAAPTQAPASQPAAATDNGGGSISIPSLSLGSFNLNQAPDLEAKLPSTFCNQTVGKLSMGGAEAFSGSTDPTFAAALQSLGKQPSDVAFAYGTISDTSQPTCDVSFFAFQIKGVDQSQFEAVLIAAAKANGDTVSQVSLGGKNVIKDVTAGGSTTYAYVNGDTALGVQTDTDEAAAKGLAAMP